MEDDVILYLPDREIPEWLKDVKVDLDE